VVAHTSDSRDREREQAELLPDIEVVRRYGESHPEVYVGLHLAWDPPPPYVVATFSDEPEGHETALRALVAFPDRLQVRRMPYPAARLEEIRAEAHEIAKATEAGHISGSGIGHGKVRLSLWASQEVLAAQLHARYGDAVDLTVGYLHYPDCTLLKYDGSPRTLSYPERPPLLSPDIGDVSVPEELKVKSGHQARSELALRNNGSQELVLETNGSVTATVVDDDTNERVGSFEGAQTLPLVRYSAPPGMTVHVPLLIGTACVLPRLGFAVPPGEWAIEVILGFADRGRFTTPHLPLTVI
jgi:hypothetical protein